MKTVQVTPAFLPNAGGIESLLSYLLPELRKNFDVHSTLMVGSPNIWTEEFDHHGVAITIEGSIRVARFGSSVENQSFFLQK